MTSSTISSASLLLLANLLLDARDLNQDSFDWTQCIADVRKTQKEKAAARSADPDNLLAGAHINYCRPDYSTLSLKAACKQVCSTEETAGFATPIYLMLLGTWNESGEWAMSLTGRKDTPSAARIKFDADLEAAYKEHASQTF